MLQYATRTHTGLKRAGNEDALVASPELGLWVVADGMGGHEQGEVASRLAVETLCTKVEAGKPLEVAIRAANNVILRQPAFNPVFAMGTTVVAAQLQEHDYRIAWVGDSRAYRWDGALTRLTTDHSYVQELMDAGQLEAGRARGHPYRSMLTQALGVTDTRELEIGVVEGELELSNGLLLCTDGLTEELSDDEIADCLAQGRDPEDAAQRLLDGALSGGGKDNITLIWLVWE